MAYRTKDCHKVVNATAHRRNNICYHVALYLPRIREEIRKKRDAYWDIELKRLDKVIIRMRKQRQDDQMKELKGLRQQL